MKDNFSTLLSDSAKASKFKNRPLYLFLIFIILMVASGSFLLSMIFCFIGIYAPLFIKKYRQEQRRFELASQWPEIIDHIISGMNSGLSIAETIIGLSQRGPLITRSIFSQCQVILQDSGDFNILFHYLKDEFQDVLADQVCEVLDFARASGSSQASVILRTLGDAIRSDLALQREIRAKHGWIKNSALIAALAPWILLLILSTQGNTLRAYSTAGGKAVLATGLGLSLIAYLWMKKVGTMPKTPRIFP